MTNVVVVADDLTGALDTGHGFAAGGRAVDTCLADVDDGEVNPPPDADVLAVDTDSRDAPTDAAARAVERTVAGADAPLVYKKVDSTLRGNVVREVDAALAASGATLAVVAPAFPSTGRTTRDGVHRVDGTPLAAAGYGVAESSLPRVFAASAHPVDHLSLSVVDDGAAAVTAALTDSVAGTDGDSVVVTCDARTDDHLGSIAAGAAALESPPLYVGSGGLAARITVPGEPVERPRPATDGTGVLGVVGSVNPTTLDQLAAVPDAAVVRLDPAEAVRDPEATASEAVPRLADRLRDRGRAVVTAAVADSDTERAATAAADVANDSGTAVDAGDRIARALATAAAGVATGSDGVTPRGLVLTGGDVARATLDALGVTRVGLAGGAVGDGIPVGWLADGPVAGTRVVTKAGGFGDRMSIVRSLDRLSAHHE
jgi:uncharacterized protein YgbK (DUF1537 family)